MGFSGTLGFTEFQMRSFWNSKMPIFQMSFFRELRFPDFQMRFFQKTETPNFQMSFFRDFEMPKIQMRFFWVSQFPKFQLRFFWDSKKSIFQMRFFQTFKMSNFQMRFFWISHFFKTTKPPWYPKLVSIPKVLYIAGLVASLLQPKQTQQLPTFQSSHRRYFFQPQKNRPKISL